MVAKGLGLVPNSLSSTLAVGSSNRATPIACRLDTEELLQIGARHVYATGNE